MKLYLDDSTGIQKIIKFEEVGPAKRYYLKLDLLSSPWYFFDIADQCVGLWIARR